MGSGKMTKETRCYSAFRGDEAMKAGLTECPRNVFLTASDEKKFADILEDFFKRHPDWKAKFSLFE